MSLGNGFKQVVIGPLNSVDNAHSVGAVDGISFIACAVGLDVFILTVTFDRIQTISQDGDSFGPVTAVNCCTESGRIAISHNIQLRVFEPILRHQTNDEKQDFPFRWSQSQNWHLDTAVENVQWILGGLRLLVFAGNVLLLYQHKVLSSATVVEKKTQPKNGVKFTLNSDDENVWEIAWTTQLASRVKHVRVSSDGALFATCGHDDSFVKIWYQQKDSNSFSFVYLQHPSPVFGFEWRHSSGYFMPKRWAQNALITWCADKTARIWKETPSRDAHLELNFSGAVEKVVAVQQESEQQQTDKIKKNPKMGAQMKRARGRLMHKLGQLINEKRKVSTGADGVSFPTGPTSEMLRSPTFADFSLTPFTSGDTLAFNLVATINAENDCFLVPSLDGSLSNNEKRNSQRIFSVHWLNNKEHRFILSTLQLLMDALPFSGSENGVRDFQALHSLHSSTSSAGIAAASAVDLLDVSSHHPPPHSVTSPNLSKTTAATIEEAPSAKDLLDYKLEMLLRQWNKSSDLLFAIHPLDGSLMTWTLEWLDDAWKQPTVSFASRLPDAFPLADVASMSIWLHIWHPFSQHGFNALYFSQHNKWSSDEENQQNPFGHLHANNSGVAERDDVCLLTKQHNSRSLDLWRFQIDEQSDRSYNIFGVGRRAEPHLLSVPFSIASVLHEFRLSEEQKSDGNTLLEVLSCESLFDASSLVNPLLPQYHPTQLVGLLNSGRIQRVKAILLNILRSLCQRQQGTSPLFKMGKHMVTRQRQKVTERNWEMLDEAQLRRNSISMRASIEAEGGLDYDEMAAVNPLPLYALLASDNASDKTATRTKSDVQSAATAEMEDRSQNASGLYDALFTPQSVEDELDLDSAEVESFSLTSRKQSVSRTRKISSGSLEIRAFASSNPNAPPPTNLTAKHSRLLTEMLTHIHLPGLSSVDQMHLLAVADTISHFSTNAVVDRLTQANAELQPIVDRSSSLGDSAASGYALSGSGIETVDECGLRFLMAKKQHEYLLRCLPIKQRRALKAKGISSAYIIWALHSNTEMELLNSIPCCQRQEESWEELRSYGIAWWLRNNAMLRNCMERVAKNAFQKRQEPMDAALFYLAMRKKNVLTQLFKTVNDSRMYEFFREDFKLEKWKKGALKNAFVLMSKQRFQHAAAFFLLGGSLKDAIQTILSRIGDLQLALVVLRFYESDPERQFELLTELLCREILGCEPSQFYSLVKEGKGKVHFPSASRDPFERSMALWLMNEYALSAATLLEEPSTAQNDGEDEQRRGSLVKDSNLCVDVAAMPEIFNFYSFLRRHPLVIRQKLAKAGISTTSTEQFLTWTHRIGEKLNAAERQLYLRTASSHLTAGCPLLALDILSRMPAQIDLDEDNNNGKIAINFPEEANYKEEEAKRKEEVDWSLPVNKLEMENEDKLELKWSDEEEEEEGTCRKKGSFAKKCDILPNPTDDESFSKNKGPVDLAAQNLKLLATLSIITDELNTLVVGGGYEVAGGQLRLELFSWLERESAVLHRICDIQGDAPINFDAVDTLFVRPSADDECSSSCSAPISSSSSVTDHDGIRQQLEDTVSAGAVGVPPLHEAIHQDRSELRERVRLTLRRRNWLRRHRRLLFTLAAYCALQSAKNSRLIAVQMELLLLLLEVQQNESPPDAQFSHAESLPGIHSFPLLVSSISSTNVSASLLTSPLRFMMDQYVTLIQTINEQNRPPQIDSDKAKFQNMFNLCQVLSLCVYQSLSDVEDLAKKTLSNYSGPLTLPLRRHSNAGGKVSADGGDVSVVTLPSHWPGVNNLIALLSRERIRSEKAPPNLRLLLVEFFVAIVMSIFCHAFAFYDSQWLFRLCAHPMDVTMFSLVFGGGGERRLKSAVPTRPPPPLRLSNVTQQENPQLPKSIDQQDEAAIRAKLHAKVFRIDAPSSKGVSAPAVRQQHSEQIIQCWVPPKKHIVQYFAEKVTIDDEMAHQRGMGDFYDSDDETPPENKSELNDRQNNFGDELGEGQWDGNFEGNGERETRAHEAANGYAWTVLRLAIMRHIQHKLRNFVEMVGFDLQEIAHLSPKLNLTMKRFNSWASQLENELEGWKDGCPCDFLPNMSPISDANDSSSLSSSSSWSSPLLHKYRLLIEPGNSPFEYVAPGVRAVRRLWNFLILQENLAPIFVRYSFAKAKDKIASSVTKGADLNSILNVIKLVHREHDPIVAFAANSIRPGVMVVSTGRELQELSIDRVLDEHERVVSRLQHYPSTSSFLLAQNWAELDISMQQIRRDPLRDNDDYQLLIPGSDGQPGKNIPTQTSAHLRKRLFSGVRRLEAHSSLPYYASGSSDGSVFLWEWGVEQPVFVARVAGQFAKVAKLAFAQNGARFAAVDGDGLLSIWQAQPGVPAKKPYFIQKCHTKFASDVKFLGQTSTLLVTAGLGMNDQNITLWDILMPQSKCAVHSFVGHPDGAFCVAYQPNTQSLISGGKHGEICIWDVRQRQLRATLRAFDNASASVRCICLDPNGDIIAAGSSEGDIKVWSSASVVPQLLYSLPTEHAARSGFSLRQVASVSLQGVQQISIDSRMNMCSCGADNSLKLRIIPSFSASCCE